MVSKEFETITAKKIPPPDRDVRPVVYTINIGPDYLYDKAGFSFPKKKRIPKDAFFNLMYRETQQLWNDNRSAHICPIGININYPGAT